jgi:protein-tyrosine phosphatase
METLTQKIFQAKSPWNNPYQGQDKKVLFVCSAGILRSATAARIYAKKYNTRAAGSESYALVPVTNDLLLWANKIVFVNEENYQSVKQYFDLDAYNKDIVILDIPDQYPHMHPELIKHFETQFESLE